MKKLLIFTLLAICMLMYTPVLAESGKQGEDPSTATFEQFTFNQLGFTETRLLGPFDSTGLQISFPEEWKITEPANLHLEFSLTVYGTDYIEGIDQLSGLLSVSANNTNLASIPLNKVGENTLDLTITPEELLSQRTDGRFDLSFDLLSQESCIRDIEVELIIREYSYLSLSHTSAAPVIDLTLFPRPFFQPDALYERKAVMVVPDLASKEELQAAMDVSAGFGYLTDGEIGLDLITFSDLTTELKTSNNLVLIGKPSSLSTLAELDTPITLIRGKYEYVSAGVDDGLIQILVSPWDETKAILVVSGNTDAGIVKSGQAIKTGEILTAERKDISFVQDYRPQNPAPSLAENQSFLDLGYEDRTVNFAGTSSIYIDFYIPPQQQVSNEANLSLHFSYSEMLIFENSGMTIYLNGRAISSIQFQDESLQLTESQIKLPPSAITQGLNQLLIQLKLVPINECSQTGFFNSTWATIFSDSSFHLPLIEITKTQPQNINLSAYPEVMVTGQTLGSVIFILDNENTNSLKAASKIAFALGERVGNILNQIRVSDTQSDNAEFLASENVMIIGRPSSTPLIYGLSDHLPAPFKNGSEVPVDNASQVVFRVVPGSDVGYLEMFQSPWNTEYLAMLVTANSDEGLMMAVDAVTGGDFRGNLAGNFAIVSGGRIMSLDTRFPVTGEFLAEQDNSATEDLTNPEPQQIPFEQRTWMIPAIAGVSLLTIVVVFTVLLPALKKSKKGE